MNRSLLSILSLTFYLCSVSAVFPQETPLSTKSKRAGAMFTEAINYYDQKDYQKAMRLLDKATQEDTGFVEAYILKGDILSDQQYIHEAIAQYKKAISIGPDFSPSIYYITANLELMNGLYGDARNDYMKFLSYSDQPKDKQDKANKSIKSCDFGINSMAHPVPFKPVNLGDSVNSPYDDYMNAVTPDEQELFLTRKLPRNHPANKEATESGRKHLTLVHLSIQKKMKEPFVFLLTGNISFLLPVTGLMDMGAVIFTGQEGREMSGLHLKTWVRL
jgi:tetratricopeptide (TPR) repeat protein